MNNKFSLVPLSFRYLGLCFILLILSVLSTHSLQAQYSINTLGGNASGVSGSVSFSLGQVSYTYHGSGQGTVSDGVQQAYEIFIIGIEESTLAISLHLFPNPTSDQVILLVNEYGQELLSYKVFDSHGKLIGNERIVNERTIIDLSANANSTYFLHVVDHDHKTVQAFKVIKTF